MMTAFCDNCGESAKAVHAKESSVYLKPRDWWERTDEDGTQLVCSRKCRAELSRKTGKSDVALPV